MMAWVASAYAGAWTRELGSAYAKAGADFYSAVRYVAPGEVQEDGAFFSQQYGVYGEIGVLPAWKGQLSFSLPLITGTHRALYQDAFRTTEVRTTTVRTGDLRLAAQVALHPELPLALAVDVKVPSYKNSAVGETYPAYRRLFPKPGDGQVDVGAMLYAGVAPWEGAWVEAGAGFVHRTEVFVGGTHSSWPPDLALSDGLRFSAKGGQTFGRFLPILGAEGTISPEATRYTRSFVSVSLSALVDVVPGVALEPRLAGEVWARNASQGLSGGLGVSIRR